MLRFMRIPAAVIALALLVLAAMHAAAVAPGNPAFQNRWERTDDPVLSGRVARTWIWGPEANTQVMNEPYAESPGGQRQVQYYDKSRMEINNPNGDPNNLFFVTNGLLVVELMTGKLQKGDNSFDTHNPAVVNVAGDSDDANGPTYATLAALRNLPALGDNTLITQRVNRAGVVTNDPSLAGQNIRTAQRLTVPGIDHQIAAPFWEFMNSSGLVLANGQYVNEALFTNPYYATGFPITEAYWADVKVAGTTRLVLMQCFERRCLTYTPGNPAGFATEAGNVGQHYHTWRYVQIPNEGSPTATSTSTSTSGNPTATGEATATGTSEVTATSSSTSTSIASATATTQTVLNYAYVAEIGGPTDPANDMQRPVGVAVDAGGNLYVLDSTRAHVQKFDMNGVLLTTFGREDNPGKLLSPVAVGVAPDGNVYVLEEEPTVIRIFDSNGAYLSSIDNGSGSEDGQLFLPSDIAFDQDGAIYVADSGNNRIQVFNPNGTFARKWGSTGALAGQMVTPTGIDVFNNAVFVVDSGNDRVQVFDLQGNVVDEWGSSGQDASEFSFATGITVSTAGVVFVVDSGNNRVQVFNQEGGFLAALGEAGSELGQFDTPRSVAFSSAERIYVADTDNARVQIFSTDNLAYLGKIDGDSRGRFSPGGLDGLAIDPQSGEIFAVDYQANLVKVFAPDLSFATEWGDTSFAGSTPLNNPNDVAVGPNDLLYVADGNNNRIVVFSKAGTQENAWGTTGTTAGQFLFPTGVSVDPAGNVYVVDGNNQRVQKFSATGQFLDQWGTFGTGDGLFSDPLGIRATADRVYVTDTGNNRVQIFEPDGDYIGQFGDLGAGDGVFDAPWRVTTDSDGFVYVTDTNNSRVQKFTANGVYRAQFGGPGSGDGQFDLISGIAITPSGEVVVADANNSRLQVFQGAAP